MGAVDLSDFQGDAEDALDPVDDEDGCLCDVDRHDLGCFEHYPEGSE
jgi:hypothetical protein